MSSSVSFVIPVLNEQELIADLLTQLRDQYPDCELIVVDGGSLDETVRCAMPLCDQLLLSAPGRALQMNLGGALAQAPYVFFLHADTTPQIHAQDLAAALADEPLWGFSPVRLASQRWAFRVIEWFINGRSRLTAVGTGDQMLYVQQSLFLDSGGFDPIPLMEDVAFSKRMRRLAPPLVLPESVETSSRRWEEGGIVKTVLRMWLLRAAYFCGASPRTLWRHYYGS